MSFDPSLSLATAISHDDLVSARPSQNSTPVLTVTNKVRAKGYCDSICLPLTTKAWHDRWTAMCLSPPGESDEDTERERKAEVWRANPAFELGEVTMTRLDEAEGVTVLISDWLELDATDDWIRHDAEIALRQELAYASYLNIQSAILPPPRNRAHVASYARAVNACLTTSPYMQISIQLAPYDPSTFKPTAPAAPEPNATGAPKIVTSQPKAYDEELNAMWEMWDIIRSMCDYSTRLCLALDLSLPLPTVLGSLSKWTAEPVKYIFLPAATFLLNTKGYPVLPKVTQSFLRRSSVHKPTIIISGTNLNLHSRGGETAYFQYVRHLESSSPAVIAAKKQGTVEHFAQGYQDYLQAPLQPLMDNLQSTTYQTFEQDPVKYNSYEEATYRAFADWEGTEKRVICIAGAGRGPLVSRALRALQRASKKATVYVVEKNPNAFVTLQGKQKNEWQREDMHLVFGDMREVTLPEPVDVLISELLGSFGDNELSPECLDGASRFLKPDGISIPSSYTAHIAPLSSSKLYNEARASKDDKAMETPYVVMFQAVNILSDSQPGTSGTCGPHVQECWEFEHPMKDVILDKRGLPMTNSHNVRSARLNFHIPHAGVLHGLAGYFEAVLYKNVGLSIHPSRKDQISKDMLSWFPLFFPFKDPLYLPSNSELQVSIWRLTNERQVWYEWHAESFLPLLAPPIHLEKEPSSPLLGPTSHLRHNLPPPASPVMDLVEPELSGTRGSLSLGDIPLAAQVEPEYSLVKIGQTSLHNPRGRSSWIGL